MKTVLVADDDDLVRHALVDLLTLEGYRVVAAYDGQDALEAAQRDRPDLVVADLQMPRLWGDALIDRLRAAHVAAPVIIVTASAFTPATSPARLIRKPFDIDEFLAAVETTLDAAPAVHPA